MTAEQEQEKQPEKEKDDDDEVGEWGREQAWDTLIRGNRQHVCDSYPGLIEETDQQKEGRACLIWNYLLVKEIWGNVRQTKQEENRSDVKRTIAQWVFSLLSLWIWISNEHTKSWLIGDRARTTEPQLSTVKIYIVTLIQIVKEYEELPSSHHLIVRQVLQTIAGCDGTVSRLHYNELGFVRSLEKKILMKNN